MNRSFRLIILSAFLIVEGSGAGEFPEKVMGATFKLFHPESTATCFFATDETKSGSRYLITAAHSLERMKGETAIVVLRKPLDDGSFARHDFTFPIRKDGSVLWTKHPKHDVAVIRMEEPLPIPVAALPLSDFATAEKLKASGLHICSQIFAFTYPQRFEANGAGFPVARQAICASPPLLPIETHHTFLGDFTTFSGDSGGPVFMVKPGGDGLVLGIILAQFRHDEKIKMEYEERVIHHPLGLGNILHAHFVLETLKLMESAGEKSAD